MRAVSALPGFLGGSLFLQLAQTIRASYWFVPSVMVIFAILLSALTQWLDGQIPPDWLEGLEWLYSNETVSARAVLSTIASSMITVAGVTFSMTIVSVSFASAQFGPRLINNFIRDRGNQLTLGTFIATFVFCLMVLRGVRDGVDEEDIAAFIPHMSVLVAMLMAILSIAVLIYFIHHVPETINVGNIVFDIGRRLHAAVTEMFPETPDAESPPPREKMGRNEFDAEEIANAVSIACEQSGYVRTFNTDRIFSLACKHDVKVRIEFIPGDFALSGEAVFHVWPAERADDDCINALSECFTFSPRPGKTQDARFLVDQLVEIIGRALSPGVNDPYTAINCINLLMDSLAVAMHSETATGLQLDDDGHARIVTNPYDFERLAESVFAQTAQYVGRDRNVTLHVMHMTATIGAQAEQAHNREVLRKHAERLAEIATAEIGNPVQKREIEDAAKLVIDIIEKRADLHELREGAAWLGGSG